MSRKRIKNIRVKDTRPRFKGTSRYKHFCTNCGKGPYFTDFAIYHSRNVFCSKECENAYYPAWMRWGLAVLILGIWTLGLARCVGLKL